MVYLMYDVYWKEHGKLSPEHRFKDSRHMCPWESGSWLQKTCLRTAQRTWLAQTQVFHWEMIKQLNKKYSNQKNISLCTFRELHHFYYHFTSSHFVTWNVPIGLFSFPFSSLKAIQCHFSTSFLTQWGQKPVFGHGNYYRKLFPQLQIQQMRLSPLPLHHVSLRF